MRILLVVHQFFPFFTAGTEVLTLGVARELRSRGHEVCIVAGHPGSNDLNESERWVHSQVDGFDVDRFLYADVPMLGQNSIVEIASDNPLAALHFARLVSSFKPDRVHYFHLGQLGTGLILAAEAASVPQSFTPTDFWVICSFGQLRLPDGSLCEGPSPNAGNCVMHYAQSPNRSAPVRMIARCIPTALADALVPLSKANSLAHYTLIAEVRALNERLSKTISRLNLLQRVVVPNAFMRAKLVEYGVRPDLVVESAYGVDLPEESTQVVTRHEPNRPLRVGFIGTLAPHKGAHVLVSAFKLLPQGTCSLRIHGNVSEYPEYAKKLADQSSGRSDIEFSGTFPNDSIFAVLAEIDIIVIPSIWYENTPLIMYSAQAANKIIIASDLPGLAINIKHNHNGFLFPSGDSQSLARLLQKIILDSELRKNVAANLQPPRSTAAYVDDLLSVWNAV